jgi:hypothetical protein
MGKKRKLTRRQRQWLTGRPRGQRRKNPGWNLKVDGAVSDNVKFPLVETLHHSPSHPESFIAGLLSGLLLGQNPAVKGFMDTILVRPRTVEEFTKEQPQTSDDIDLPEPPPTTPA